MKRWEEGGRDEKKKVVLIVNAPHCIIYTCSTAQPKRSKQKKSQASWEIDSYFYLIMLFQSLVEVSLKVNRVY